MIKPQVLSQKSIFGYALLAPSIAFAELPLYIYIPKYYHVVFGLNLGLIGIILLVIRSLDALKDPFLGLAVDKLLQKKMSYRNIIVLSLVPFVISYYILFHPIESLNISLSLGFSLLIFHFFDSLLNITYLSLGAAITNQYHDRTRITAYREGIKVIGVILASVLPTFFLQGEETPQKMVYSFQITTYTLVVLVVVGGLLFYRWSPLPLSVQNYYEKSPSLRATFKAAMA